MMKQTMRSSSVAKHSCTMPSKRMRNTIEKIAEAVLQFDDLPETDVLDIADVIVDEVKQEIDMDEDLESEISSYVIDYVIERCR